MARLFHWFISKWPMNATFQTRLQEIDYIGKDECYYMAQGNVMNSPKFPDGIHIHTSPIKRLEWVAVEELLRVHTVNSIYDCAVKDCRFSRQGILEVFPEPIQTILLGRPQRKPPKENSILLIFDDVGERIVAGLINREGNQSELEIDVHLGMFTDTVLLQDGIWNGTETIDIRFYVPANDFCMEVEFYSFYTAELPVFLHNASERRLTFNTPCGLIDINPGDRKQVCVESAAATSQERKAEYRVELKRRLGLKKEDDDGL